MKFSTRESPIFGVSVLIVFYSYAENPTLSWGLAAEERYTYFIIQESLRSTAPAQFWAAPDCRWAPPLSSHTQRACTRDTAEQVIDMKWFADDGERRVACQNAHYSLFRGSSHDYHRQLRVSAVRQETGDDVLARERAGQVEIGDEEVKAHARKCAEQSFEKRASLEVRPDRVPPEFQGCTNAVENERSVLYDANMHGLILL
jgi:hypothetical protein